MHARLSPFILVAAARCIGCRVCELACSAAHQRGGVSVGSLQVPLSPRLYLTSFNNSRVPIGCRHCEDAPCAEVCPNNAIMHTSNGVQVDEDRCVGCKTCLAVCPVGAMEMAQVWKHGKPAMRRVLDPSTPKGVRLEPACLASKCDLCDGREGGPACVAACPEKALTLVDPIEVKRRRNFEAALALSRTYEEV